MSISGRGIATYAVAAVLAGATSVAGAQTSYPQTLYWGAGLIDIPVAWVSPLTGDFALNYSGKTFEKDPGLPKINYNDQLNSQLTFSLSLFGRAELGVAAYSANPELGFFGQALILDEETFRFNPGVGRWMPSVAVGVRNVGKYDKIDRFGVGYSLIPGEPNYQHVPDTLHENFDTAPTIYGVATKSFSLSDIRASWPNFNMSFSVGYGNGLFKDDGNLDKQYSKFETGGLFGGVKVDFAPARYTTLSLMAENNAWDYNLGASLEYRGLRLGAYVTELASGSAQVDTAPGILYNYSKFAFTLGWQSNIFALLRGDFLQGRVGELEKQREALMAQITERQQRITTLQLEINRYEAQNLLELEQRRAQAEQLLRQEREALQRLEERLRRLEQQAPPPNPQQPPPRPPER